MQLNYSGRKTFDVTEEQTKERQQPIIAWVSDVRRLTEGARTGATAVTKLISSMLPPDRFDTKSSFNAL